MQSAGGGGGGGVEEVAYVLDVDEAVCDEDRWLVYARPAEVVLPPVFALPPLHELRDPAYCCATHLSFFRSLFVLSLRSLAFLLLAPLRTHTRTTSSSSTAFTVSFAWVHPRPLTHLEFQFRHGVSPAFFV
jgi:hypothetical protein